MLLRFEEKMARYFSGSLLILFVIFSSVYAQSDLARAEKLHEQVVALYQHGRYQEAIPLAREVLIISEKTLGPEHPKLATSLNNLALLYYSMGSYSKAEPLLKRALAIFEKALGPDSPELATSLNNLALLYDSMGSYSEVEPLLKRALLIREKTLGPEHPEVATSLNNLALLYYSMGLYAGAEPLYKRALAIREETLGPEHPEVATSLNNLAGLYYSMGSYAKAESLYQRTLVIFEKALGPGHPEVATSLNNLALLYDSIGSYAKAKPLYQRALAVREKALGPENPEVAQSLNNLAGLYRTMGSYAKAESLYQRALANREKALGPEHPELAQSLNNLAELYRTMGSYAKAESLYQRALANLVFVYIKEAGQEVGIKPAGQADWNEIRKFGRLLPGDSLKISERTTILLGDGSSAWKEFTGPKAMVITKAKNKRTKFGRYIDYLYSKFFVERHGRLVSKAGVRSSEALLLAMPDTSDAYTMPESVQWIKSAPWFTTYHIQITHNQEAVLDTLVRGNAFSLKENVKLRQRPGNYKIKVTLSQGALLATETDSSVIRLLPESQSVITTSRLDELKNQAEKKGRREDYLTLVDFCLHEKLYLDLEQGLIRMTKKFPDDHEAQAMLYAYYASFLPEEVAERYLMNRLKELR